jgi:hypothetical protein
MQHILHLIVSKGDTSFEHISKVTPWWERSLALREKAAEEFEGLEAPRVFKSHLPYRWLPALGRCIYIERNGQDVAASYFRLYRSHLGYRGTFDEFLERFVRGDLQYRSWFKHTAGWRKHKDNPRVLSLTYEQMQKDLAACIRQVADFCELALSDDLLTQVCEESSLGAMSRQQHKFDHIGEILHQRGIVQGSFIGEGKVGAGAAQLSEVQRMAFEHRLRQAISNPDIEWHIADFLH